MPAQTRPACLSLQIRRAVSCWLPAFRESMFRDAFARVSLSLIAFCYLKYRCVISSRLGRLYLLHHKNADAEPLTRVSPITMLRCLSFRRSAIIKAADSRAKSISRIICAADIAIKLVSTPSPSYFTTAFRQNCATCISAISALVICRHGQRPKYQRTFSTPGLSAL